jgi:hypothetical protein
MNLTPTPASLPKNLDIKRFCGTTPSKFCRVCGSKLSSRFVDSGVAPFETSWHCCDECDSWSIAHEPDEKLLDIFYSDYSNYLKLSAVNPGNNDGRRYTNNYREVREREYRLGLNDVGLALKKGNRIVDFGAQDSVFLDVCVSMMPHLEMTVAVDYSTSTHKNGTHQFMSIDDWNATDMKFDVVTLWDVYEHIPNLQTFFSTLIRSLVPGGEVLVQTPRADLYAEHLGPAWHHFLPVQHLQLPSRRGIVKQFSDYGFELMKAVSFGANASPEIVPQPYKKLFDHIAKITDRGSTQILKFTRTIG